MIHTFNWRKARFWLIVATLVFALLGFEEIVDDVFHDPLEGDHEASHFDRAISSFFASFRTPGLTQSMIDLTALGSVSVITVLSLVILWTLLHLRDFRGLAFLLITLAGSALWPMTLKLYFQRHRPPSEEFLVTVSDLSFPSGHAFGATAAYLAFAYCATRFAKTTPFKVSFFVIAFVLSALVGVSRIYLGVHFPTDVLAGWLGGVAWSSMTIMVFELTRIKTVSAETEGLRAQFVVSS